MSVRRSVRPSVTFKRRTKLAPFLFLCTDIFDNNQAKSSQTGKCQGFLPLQFTMDEIIDKTILQEKRRLIISRVSLSASVTCPLLSWDLLSAIILLPVTYPFLTICHNLSQFVSLHLDKTFERGEPTIPSGARKRWPVVMVEYCSTREQPAEKGHDFERCQNTAV